MTIDFLYLDELFKFVFLYIEMRVVVFQMRDLRHMNINPFVGACVDSSNFIIITEYCFKGSLQVSTSEDILYL